MKTENEKTSNERILRGIGISERLAIGPAYLIDQSGVPVPNLTLAANQVEGEQKRLQAAIAKTQRQLSLLRQKAEGLPAGPAEEVTLLLDAYKGMLSGSRLVRGVEKLIADEKINAEAAVQRQITSIAASFAAMKDEYLAARVNDVREVGQRLIRNLMQEHYNPFADAPEGSVLLAEEITPADAAMIDPNRIGGFVSLLGGIESHAAIMGRALNLAAILGITEPFGDIAPGDTIILDGTQGLVIVRPQPETLQHYKQEVQKMVRDTRRLKSLRDVPATTMDGITVNLQANLELPWETEAALEAGATGIGLLRTEFLFMNRPDMPSEDEQFETLRGMVKKLAGKPLTVRTLDVGGDKLPASFRNLSGESPNPALSLRAIRLGLKAPRLLETQLAAILRAAAYGPVRILVPMISSVEQIEQVREHLFQAERRLRRRGVRLPNTMPLVGAMIEIPSAALTADAMAKVCDFFAIGSNDLTQYSLAIDRSDERVADLYNPFHPAVLRLIQITIASAWRANIPVSLCGEMGANPAATPLLLGLGLREFSVSPARLPTVKQNIRALDMAQAVAFAEAVMNKPRESDINRLLEEGAAAFAEGPKKKR